jgi:TolA-binding protein
MDDVKIILQKLERMEGKINSIERNQVDHQERSEKTSVRVQRIERLMKGDEEYEQKGFIHEVKEIKVLAIDTSQKFQKYKADENIRTARKVGLFAGLGLTGGGFGAWLKTYFGF